MSVYTVVVDLDPGQDKAMKDIAANANKTVQGILDEQVAEKVVGQINQWIDDRVKAELKKLTPAEALTKLKYL